MYAVQSLTLTGTGRKSKIQRLLPVCGTLGFPRSPCHSWFPATRMNLYAAVVIRCLIHRCGEWMAVLADSLNLTEQSPPAAFVQPCWLTYMTAQKILSWPSQHNSPYTPQNQEFAKKLQASKLWKACVTSVWLALREWFIAENLQNHPQAVNEVILPCL